MTQTVDRRGLLFGASAYLIWGVFPLLMHAMIPAGALEITAQRAVWSLVVCLLIVAAVRGWGRLRVALTTPRTVLTLAVAAVLIAANWLIYVYAVVSDRVAFGSLGYYINPLVTVALGVVVLGERLRRTQVVAVGIAALAVVVIGVEMRQLPWISLALAASFGVYGLIKKRVGGHVDAITGLTVETTVLVPFGVLALVILHANGTLTLGARGAAGLGVGHDLLLVSSGAATVGALLLFAAGAARLPLNVTGLLQYITPTMMFMLAVWHFHEPMPPGRWTGFALVWVALILITADSWRSRARVPRSEAEIAEEPV